MKKCILILSMLSISASLTAQESRLEIVPKSIFVPVADEQKPNPQVIDLLQGKLTCSVIGIPIQKTDIDAPFKIYTVENDNWMIQQDLYNSMMAKVPSLQVAHMALDKTPNIRMRGTHNTIVLVDGITYDLSILNTLNLNHSPTAVPRGFRCTSPWERSELYFRSSG